MIYSKIFRAARANLLRVVKNFWKNHDKSMIYLKIFRAARANLLRISFKIMKKQWYIRPGLSVSRKKLDRFRPCLNMSRKDRRICPLSQLVTEKARHISSVTQLVTENVVIHLKMIFHLRNWPSHGWSWPTNISTTFQYLSCKIFPVKIFSFLSFWDRRIK